MKIRVRLFARLRDIAGAEFIEAELPAESTVATLRSALAVKYPDLAGFLQRSAIAVRQEFANGHQVLNEDDEVALIPPVSGG